jgi:hypothetical protein
MATKHIRTSDNQIIVFSEYHQHSEFKHYKPISAGFISFCATGEHELKCSCYGESVSLGLKSDEAFDTMLAMRQILGNHDY